MGGRPVIIRCELCNREMRGGHKHSPHRIGSWGRSRVHEEIQKMRELYRAIAEGGSL